MLFVQDAAVCLVGVWGKGLGFGGGGGGEFAGMWKSSLQDGKLERYAVHCGWVMY